MTRRSGKGIEIVVTSGRSEARAITSEWTRWGQLVLGIVCLVMIANLQYGWTLFINPIDQKYHWGRAAIQVIKKLICVDGCPGHSLLIRPAAQARVSSN